LQHGPMSVCKKGENMRYWRGGIEVSESQGDKGLRGGLRREIRHILHFGRGKSKKEGRQGTRRGEK